MFDYTLYNPTKMNFKLFIGNMCFVFSIGSFIAAIIISIRAVPELSILWIVWFISTAAYPMLNLPSSIDIPLPKQFEYNVVPMQTVLIQHPDGTLNIDTNQYKS